MEQNFKDISHSSEVKHRFAVGDRVVLKSGHAETMFDYNGEVLTLIKPCPSDWTDEYGPWWDVGKWNVGEEMIELATKLHEALQ